MNRLIGWAATVGIAVFLSTLGCRGVEEKKPGRTQKVGSLNGKMSFDVRKVDSADASFRVEVSVFPAGNYTDTIAHTQTTKADTGWHRHFHLSGLSAPDTVDVVGKALGWNPLKETDFVLKGGSNEISLFTAYPLPEILKEPIAIGLREGTTKHELQRMLAPIDGMVEDTTVAGVPGYGGPSLAIRVSAQEAADPDRVTKHLAMSPHVLYVQAFSDFEPPQSTASAVEKEGDEGGI